MKLLQEKFIHSFLAGGKGGKCQHHNLLANQSSFKWKCISASFFEENKLPLQMQSRSSTSVKTSD